MAWIEVSEPYATPPRLPDPLPDQIWSGAVDRQAGWWELVDTAIVGDIGLTGCEHLEIRGSTFTDSALARGEPTLIDVFESTFERCDLSGARFEALRVTRFVDCKLVGADFSGIALTDVAFERCELQLVNLRMAKLERVRFVDCRLHELDAYGVSADDVSFAESDLDEVNLDRLDATRVDLRGTRRLGLENLGDLDGCLVNEEQVPALMYQLALATGLSIARSDDLG